MSRRKDQSHVPGQPSKPNHAASPRHGSEKSLHVFSPVDSGVPAPRVVSPSAADASGGDVVVGFAGQSTAAARQRCTLYLSPEVNAQLDLAAHLERKERSQVVEVILQQYLPKYRVERA